MDRLDPALPAIFFQKVAEHFAPEYKAATFVTTHILPDRPYFLHALSTISNVISVTPKPKSIHRNTLSWLSHKYNIDIRNRAAAGDVPDFANFIVERAAGNKVIFVDVGGYYANVINPLNKIFPDQILGVVEDTENGHKRYSGLKSEVPVISVARSPLKNPEDFLVGQSIVFSAEALLRQNGDILQGRRAAVLGYGKLGRSIAGTLRERHVETVVVDTDGARLVEAHSHGFPVTTSLEKALADVGFVFSATGNEALSIQVFQSLPSGCYVATATSSDDEIDTRALKDHFRRRRISDFISKYEPRLHSVGSSKLSRPRHFYLLNHGQAVNFLHGAVVGPFIYLIQAEIVAAVGLLSRSPKADKNFAPGLNELDSNDRLWIADQWLEIFNPQ